MIYYGIDIGGTKCAVTTAKVIGGEISIMEKESFPTPKKYKKITALPAITHI